MPAMDANFYFLLNQLHDEAQSKLTQIASLEAEMTSKQNVIHSGHNQQSLLELRLTGQSKHIELMENRCSELSSQLASQSKEILELRSVIADQSKLRQQIVEQDDELANLKHALRLQMHSERSGRPMEKCDHLGIPSVAGLRKQMIQLQQNLDTKTEECRQLVRKLGEVRLQNELYTVVQPECQLKNSPTQKAPSNSLVTIDNKKSIDNVSSCSERESTLIMYKFAPIPKNITLGLTEPLPYRPDSAKDVHNFESAVNLVDRVQSQRDEKRLSQLLQSPQRIQISDQQVNLHGSSLERTIAERVQSIRKRYQMRLGKQENSSVEM